jgi:hypothetical protein
MDSESSSVPPPAPKKKGLKGLFSQPDRACVSVAVAAWLIYLAEFLVTLAVRPSPNNFVFYFTIGLTLILSIIILLPVSIYQAVKALSKGIGSAAGPVISLIISVPPLLAFVAAFVYAVFFKGRVQ